MEKLIMADPKDQKEGTKKNPQVEPRREQELDDKDLDKAAGGVTWW
jgi:hypothetical protein